MYPCFNFIDIDDASLFDIHWSFCDMEPEIAFIYMFQYLYCDTKKNKVQLRKSLLCIHKATWTGFIYKHLWQAVYLREKMF